MNICIKPYTEEDCFCWIWAKISALFKGYSMFMCDVRCKEGKQKNRHVNNAGFNNILFMVLPQIYHFHAFVFVFIKHESFVIHLSRSKPVNCVIITITVLLKCLKALYRTVLAVNH